MKMYSTKDAEYAITRLQQCIVMYKGTPVEVATFGPIDSKRITVACMDVLSGKPVIADYNDLDITPVKVGYVNWHGLASYVTRMPMRGDYRQGLRYNNITSLSGHASREIPYSAIGNAIINKYPKLPEALAELKKDWTSCAWHKEWAVDVKGSLIYRGTNLVGSIVEGRCSLAEHSAYLQEALDDALREMAARK